MCAGMCYTCGCNNTALGQQALNANTTGNYNTAIGMETLKCNTCGNSNIGIGFRNLKSNTEGEHNTALGFCALNANTSGDWNIAIGQNSLKDNTTGKSNTALGYYAMCNNCTGCYNIGIGHQALFEVECTNGNVGIGFYAGLNTTGSCNIAIGQQTMQNNTCGNLNSALGHQAMYSTTTGCHNIALGPNSLYSNVSASDNVMIGYSAGCKTNAHNNVGVGNYALACNESGIQNVAVGRCAMQQNTFGTYNTTIGGSSLKNNTTGGFNVAVGNVALFCNTNASNNVAVGYGAAYNNTTASGTVAIGFYANFNNCTAIFNTTVGAQAMQCNTGGCNTAVGYCALHNNSTSTRNTAVGMKAGVSNTTGGSNTIVGSEAMLLNATGNYNTALGQAALYANTCAHCNVAVGGLALRFNTEGNYHTAVGTGALYCNTTSTWNTAVGFCAGYEITTGGQNTLLGPYAGHKTATGQQNTYLGYAAGRCNVSSNNVAIGHNAARCQADGCSALTCAMSGIYIGDSVKGCQGEINSIAIGYGACSCGSNTVNIGNSETTNTYLNGNVTFNCSLSTNCSGIFSALSAEDSSKCNYFAGNVGIGAKSPSTILEVSGTGAGAAGIDLSQGEGSTISNRLFFSTGTPSQGIALYNLAGSLVFSTGAQPANTSGDARMYLTNGGNLGIGTSSPSCTLTVQGSISSNGSICTTGSIIRNPGTTSSGGLCVRDCSNARPWRIYGTGPGGCQVIETSGTSNPIHFGSELGGAINIKTCDTTRIFLSGGGTSVGIGTTAPGSILQLQGDGGNNKQLRLASGSSAVYWDIGRNYNTGHFEITEDSGSTYFLIDKDNGNVGIGASSPSDRLTVQGDISGSGDICLVDNGIIKLGTGNDLQLQHDGANSYISENGTGDLWLTSNNASIYLQDSNSGRTMLAAKGGSGEKVELYHSGSKKFETMSDGASVFGDLSASGNGYFDCVIAGGYFEEKAANDELAEYETGSLVVLGQDGELEISTRRNDRKVFGVTQKGSRQPIVLGAEPVLVTGKIRVGDFISTSDKPGHGQRMGDTFHGAVIAQAMESGEGDSFLIKAMIRKM